VWTVFVARSELEVGRWERLVSGWGTSIRCAVVGRIVWGSKWEKIIRALRKGSVARFIFIEYSALRAALNFERNVAKVRAITTAKRAFPAVPVQSGQEPVAVRRGSRE
jgi:hypothetical protein